MPEATEISNAPKTGESPLIFISHDSRDAELAEAFSKLLKSVSAGMLKSFRSSDKKGTEGIEFGDEWYKTLMAKLETASDVVCLLTERSLDRPWILYEAGVAKGKLGTPVHGIALGVPLSRVSAGPFYQFQNSDDSEDSLSKLVVQLCHRVHELDPDKDVVKTQVHSFITSVQEAQKAISNPKKVEKPEAADEGAVAKILEEVKLVVRELTLRMDRGTEVVPDRYRPRHRQLNPRIIPEMVNMISRRPYDPIGILIIVSLVREDFPWLYEIGCEAYRAAMSGNTKESQELLLAFRMAADYTFRSPLLKEIGIQSKGAYMMYRELAIEIEQYIQQLEDSPRKRERFEELRDLKRSTTGSVLPSSSTNKV
ncbi:MAG: TIR domain-containing protein [Chloroflexi bacterium]|nr:MAG: TIR domain-containing protein [Chloroflexota bacterium]